MAEPAAAGNLPVYLAIAAAATRVQARRPAQLVVRFLTSGLVQVAEAAGFALLADRFSGLAGWSAPQVVLLYGLGTAGQGVALALGERLHPGDFSELVRRGTFDQVLARPVAPLGWIVASGLDLRFLGRALTALAMLAWAVPLAGVAWTPGNLAVVGLSVACCAAVMLAVLVLGAAVTLRTVEGSELVNAFTYGGVFLTSLPMELYGSALRFVFTWVVPFGLAVYVPALVLLGRAGPPGLAAGLVWVTPAATAALLALAGLGWRLGVRGYLGTGS